MIIVEQLIYFTQRAPDKVDSRHPRPFQLPYGRFPISGHRRLLDGQEQRLQEQIAGGRQEISRRNAQSRLLRKALQPPNQRSELRPHPEWKYFIIRIWSRYM